MKKFLILAVVAVLLGLSFSASGARADPIERDCFPSSTAEITIETPMGPDWITLSGPTMVEVDLGSLADADGDGLEQIDTEIVSMELTGFSGTLMSEVIIRVPQAPHPGVKSVGEIEENENVQPGRLDLPGGDLPFCGDPPPPNCVGKTADSFFDVFFEIEIVNSPYLPPSIKLHNHDPKRLDATITHKPPATGETYESPDPAIQLFDELDNPTPVYIGAAEHTPGPPRGCGVGGIIEVQVGDSDSPASLADGSSSSSPPYAALAGAAAAGALAILAAGWYARRRWVR